MTVTFSVQDNADNENGRRLQRSTDGGSTWTTVDNVGANTTALEDPNPVLYEPVLYRSQVYTEHVVSNTQPITVIAVRGGELYAEIGSGADTIALNPDDWTEASITPEHTGIWRATLSVAPADRGTLGYAFDALRLFYGSQQFFDGSIRTPGIDDGVGRLEAFGKTRELREDTAIVTYPDALGVSAAALQTAIADYWSRTPASATVTDSAPSTVRQDELFYDLPDPTDFTAVVDVAADVPVDVQPDRIDHAPVRFFAEAEDGTGSGTVIDTVDAPSDHSNAQAVELNTAGQKREIQFTPEHDIPWDDFVPRLRYEYETFDGHIYVTLNDQRIGLDAVGGPATQAAEWGGSVNLSANGTVGSPPTDPLKAGTTYSFGVEVDVDANNNFGGSVIVDCFAPGDSGSRFGGYGITEDNSVDFGAGDGVLGGPQRYPDATKVPITVDEDWRVSESTVDSTWDDTTGQQAIVQTIASDVVAENTTSQTVDWDAEDQFGTTLTVAPRLSRYTTDATTSPATGDTGQSVTGLEVRVTTDDTAVVEDSNPIVLDADTYLENAQTLHEAGAWRFTTDHSVSGLVVESYRKGDPNAVKTADWTLLPTDGSEDRDTLDYANRINGVGDGVDFSLTHTAEVTRVGEEVPVGRSYPSISDADVLIDEMRRDVLDLVTNDERSGTLQIAPTLVLPGYPYDVPAFGGERASLNGVTLRFGAGVAEGRLEFGVRRTLGRRVARQD